MPLAKDGLGKYGNGSQKLQEYYGKVGNDNTQTSTIAGKNVVKLITSGSCTTAETNAGTCFTVTTTNDKDVTDMLALASAGDSDNTMTTMAVYAPDYCQG